MIIIILEKYIYIHLIFTYQRIKKREIVCHEFKMKRHKFNNLTNIIGEVLWTLF